MVLVRKCEYYIARGISKNKTKKKTPNQKAETLGSCCNLFGTQTTLLLDSQLLKGVEHTAQRVLCAGYTNNLIQCRYTEYLPIVHRQKEHNSLVSKPSRDDSFIPAEKLQV